MSQQHKINELLVEIDFDNQPRGEQFQGQASAFMKQHILPLVEQIFDQQSNTDEVISIDMLEIDLGDIEQVDLLTQIEQKFKVELTQKLKDIIPRKGAGNTLIEHGITPYEKVTIASKRDSLLAQLAFYLQHGIVAWNFEASSQGYSPAHRLDNHFHNISSNSHQTKATTHSHWLNEAVEQQLRWLVTFLDKNSARSPQIMERLFYQLNPVTLNKLAVQLSAPQQNELIKLLVKHPHSEQSKVLSEFINAYTHKQGKQLAKQNGKQHNEQKLAENYIGKNTSENANKNTNSDDDKSTHTQNINIDEKDSTELSFLVIQAIRNGTPQVIEPQWTLLIKEQPTLLAQLLRTHAQASVVHRLLVKTFSKRMLKDIIQVIEPRDHHFIVQILEYSHEVLPLDKTAKQYELNKNSLWEFSLEYLLVERGSEFNKISYLGSVLKKIARHENSNYPQLLVNLYQRINHFTGSPELKQQLLTIVQRLAQVDDISLLSPEKNASTEQATILNNATTKYLSKDASMDAEALVNELNINDVLVRVVTALIQGDEQNILRYWHKLMIMYPALLAELLTYHGQLVTVRNKLASGFSEARLVDIIEILTPQAKDFILSVIKKSDWFAVSSNASYPINPSQESVQSTQVQPHLLKQSMWEFTLGYLLVERGSRFNKKDYLASILRQMAAHHNSHYHALLMSMVASIKASSSLNNSEWITLLVELAETQGGDVNQCCINDAKLPENQRQFDSHVLSAFDAYLALECYLTNKNSLSAEQFSDNLAVLAKHEPLLLQRLLKASHGGEIQWANVVILLTHSQLQVLLKAFVSLNYYSKSLSTTSENNNVSYFMQAVSKQIKSCTAQREIELLFTLLFTAVAAEQPIDFEQLTQAVQKKTAAPIADIEEARAEEQSPEQFLMAYFEQQKADQHYQINTGNNSPAQLAKLVATIERLLATNQRSLKDLLRNSLQVPSISKHLSQHLPQWLLIKLLALLQPSDYVNVQSDNQQITFMHAVSKQVNSCTSQRQIELLFTLLFTAVATEQPIDFEQLTQAVQHKQASERSIVDADLSSMDENIGEEADQYLSKEATVEEQSPEQFLIAYFEQQKAHQTHQINTANNSPAQMAKLVASIELLLATNQRSLKDFLRSSMQVPSISRLLSQQLPERLLIKLLLLLQPSDYANVQRYSRLLINACYSDKQLSQRLSGLHIALDKIHYQYLFQYLIVEGRPFNAREFIIRFINYLASTASNVTKSAGIISTSSSASHSASYSNNNMVNSNVSSELALFISEQLKASNFSAEQTLRERVINIIDAGLTNKTLERKQHLPSVRSNTLIDAKTSNKQIQNKEVDEKRDLGIDFTTDDNKDLKESLSEPWVIDEKAVNEHEPISISNAGLVLAAPYIPRLFTMLGLTSDGVFKQPEDAHRAIHLLQYMVNGNTQTAEYQLVLNKLLCGIKIATPVPYQVEISEQEKVTIDSMLIAIIQHWKALGCTSKKGLQQTFVQRDGTLICQEEAWSLTVEQSTFDMLLDQIPWSYSLIKFPWMEQPLHVQWR